MAATNLVARFGSAAEYLIVHRAEVVHGGLLVRGAALPAGTALGDCMLLVDIQGADPVEVEARLGGATPGLGVLVLFDGPPAPLLALAALLEGGPAPSEDNGLEGELSGDAPPDEEPPPDPNAGPSTQVSRAAAATRDAAAIRARETMTIPEKMRLASSGDREVRFALLRDPNKQLHPMVLKNPRIGLDEVLWAAKLSSLSPDALKVIADHPEWGKAPAIAAALVRNPKTPVPVALKLLPRVALGEVRAIAKSQGRPQIVQAARKIVSDQR